MIRPRLKSQIREHTNRTVDVPAELKWRFYGDARSFDELPDQWASKLLAPFVPKLLRRRPERRPPPRSRLSNQMFAMSDFNGFRLMIWRQGRDQKQGWPSPFISRLNRHAQA